MLASMRSPYHCRAKLNTIKDLISKALIDEKISHEEFLLVMSEIDKYHSVRNSIRQKNRKQPSQLGKTEQPDIEKIKKEIRDELMKKLLNQEGGKPS